LHHEQAALDLQDRPQNKFDRAKFENVFRQRPARLQLNPGLGLNQNSSSQRDSLLLISTPNTFGQHVQKEQPLTSLPKKKEGLDFQKIGSTPASSNRKSSRAKDDENKDEIQQ